MADLEAQMLKRTRQHMLVSLGGVVLGVGVLVAAHSAIGMLGIALIPAIGLYSSYRILRCPSCDRRVAMMVSANYSPMGASAPKNCPGCGQKIFGDGIVKRFWRMVVTMIVLMLGLLLIAGVGGYLSRKG